MINESIAQLQAQLAEVDDQYLAEQAKNPNGMTGLMAAIEMSKRSKMRDRAAAVSDSYARKDGTVVQDTLSKFQAAQAPAPEPMPAQGYADGGRVQEYGATNWWDQFNQEPPWKQLYEGYEKPAPRQSNSDAYSGLDSAGAKELALLNYDRRRNPQSPSPDYDMPAGPALPPSMSAAGAPYSPYDAYSSLPIISNRAPQDPVMSGVQDAVAIAGSARPGMGASVGGGGVTRSAVRDGNAASAPGTPNFESEYEKLLAGIKGDAPEKLKPPKELGEIDTARVERLNRAMALGAMAKQFATNNNFVAGFGSGAADASAIMAAGRRQLQGEQMDRAKIQSTYDLTNSEIAARQRLADTSAANNINLARINSLQDVALSDRNMAHDREMQQLQISGQERIANIQASHANASKALEFEFRQKLAEMEMADANGMWDKKADLERELAGIQLRSRELDAEADRELKRASILSSSVTDMATSLIGQGLDPMDAYQQAHEAVFGPVGQQPLPKVKRVP